MARQITTTYRPGKQQEFGWLPPIHHAELNELGYSQFLGQGATSDLAVVDLLWKIQSETGEVIKTKDCYIIRKS